MSLQIDENKARKAFKALYKHEKTRQSDAIQWIWLMITTFNPIDLGKGKPTRILLKHAIQSADTQRCLFTKDPQRTYKDLLVSNKIKGIHKVISISKLKKDYTPEERQQLFDNYDVFMADQQILPLLPKILGRQWYKKRNAIKIASTGHNEMQAYENLMDSISSIVKNVPGGAKNIRALQIKSAESTSLPVYEAAVVDEENGEESEFDSEEEE
ncbi:hypothetical protein DFQ28_008487 [Apophysomyces sp. BC1034]|nr:hypothetical protein DFQ30_009282 [Apophysomyces sp. BC1015]KAG0181810.1 hypothetical protein DFQ29_006921 [Apophysomyces sp. BC1021]KAG0192611.1 hypothetical protein DFQ28_008487 [Apophysomyces sp. BC1034]